MLLSTWGVIGHRHKHLITKGNLQTGSLYNLKEEDYPGITKGAATSVYLKYCR